MNLPTSYTSETRALDVSTRVHGDGVTLDQLVATWLHSKYQRSRSERTRDEYASVLASFRELIAAQSLDLDDEHVETLTLLAQGWAALDRASDHEPVAATTHNRRLAIVSSFYRFALRHGLRSPEYNPIERVERRVVQAYAHAHALSSDELATRLAQIDRATLIGARDYTLLRVALSTGRRLSELAQLRLADLALVDDRYHIVWRRTKGGKVMRDTLSAQLSAQLHVWLLRAYDHALPDDGPVWLSLWRGAHERRAMSRRAISNVYLRRLGVSKVHTSRHSHALLMNQSGATLTDIQQQLGHANVATTGLYMRSLRAGDNPFADKLDELMTERETA